MRFINETLVYINNTAQYLKELLVETFIEHPNACLHVVITMLFTIIMIKNMHIKLTNKRLNEMDKRYTILLLSIQTYCASLNRAVNEVQEMFDKNIQIIIDNDNKLLSRIRIAHQRVKDVYTGLFKHLGINKIKRAPKRDAQQGTDESTEHNEFLREVINEMMVTDFISNH